MTHVPRAFTVLILLSTFAWAQTRMISHVTRADGGFNSTVVVENLAAAEQSFTLTPFGASGEALTPFEGTLAAGGVLSMLATELFQEGDRVSHFGIEADEAIEVTVAYNFNGPGSPAHVPASAERASGWRIFPGDWDLVFDGLALVNTGENPTDIWIAQKDFEGNFLQSQKIATAMAPNAKALYVVGSPDGSAFSRETPSYFEITADQKLAVTALRGTLGRDDIGLLWANEAQARSQSETKRDDAGVWFITDGSLYDVFETMGYNVATDRLWQLELFRMNSLGKLAKVFGPSLEDADVIIRESMYSNAELEAFFEDLQEENKTILRAYVHGINRRISQVHSNFDLLPFEFKQLGINPIEPWVPTDVMAWMAVAQRTFSLQNLGTLQILNGALAITLIEFAQNNVPQAAMMFEDIRWVNDLLAPTMIPATPQELAKAAAKKRPMLPWKKMEDIPDIRPLARRIQERVTENVRQLKRIGAHVKIGSYAWVVSGAKAASGNPILFSGPQLDFTLPVPIIEGSVASEVFTASGMLVPGIPAFIIGRTPHHAWSFQVGHTHTWDYYVEDFTTVALDRRETVEVAGAPDVELNIYRSGRGPVLFRNSRGPVQPTETLLSWKYSHWGREFDLWNGIVALVRAQNIDEFGEGVAHLGISQHVCYADREGNIAYWMSGRNPVRPEGNYRFPQGLILSPVEYDIDVVNPVVHDRNPAQGWYGGWNNKASASVDDPTATFGFGPFHRAHLIQDFLRDNDNLTFEDLKALEFDIANTFNLHRGGNQWPTLRDVFGFEAIINANPTPERLEALAIIQNWHGHLPAGEQDNWLETNDFHEAQLLHRFWIIRVVELIFNDELGPPEELEDSEKLFGTMYHDFDPSSGITNLYNWIPNLSDPDAPQTFEDTVVQALDETLVFLGDRPWGVEERDLTDYTHDLLGTLHARPFLNRSVYTQCVELDDSGPIRIESVFALGQSGTLFSDDNFQPITAAGNPVGPGMSLPGPEDPFFGMRELFDNFLLRPFPLFSQ